MSLIEGLFSPDLMPACIYGQPLRMVSDVFLEYELFLSLFQTDDFSAAVHLNSPSIDSTFFHSLTPTKTLSSYVVSFLRQ